MSVRSRRLRAVTLAGALVGYAFTAGLELPSRRHPAVQGALGAALAVGTRAPVGMRPPQLWSGLRMGGVAAGAVLVGVAAVTAVPPVHAAMAARELPEGTLKWLTLKIPIGTVWLEELAFRGALRTSAAEAFGRAGGRLLQAIAFGLSHIPDARSAGESVLGTVVVTGLAGWTFGWLADRSDSLVAPMLAHLAINEAGAVAAIAVQRWKAST